MRSGLAISSVLHGTILLWAIVSFTTTPFEAENSDSLPVDIVSTTDFSKMMAGSKTAPKAETPKPLVEKVAEAKPAPDPAAKVTEKKEIVTAAEEPPPPQKTESKPEKKEPEPKVDPIAEALKKEETKKKEEQKDEAKKQAETKPVPIPRKKPPQQKFDPAKVAALLDKRDPQRQAVTGAEVSRTASLGFANANSPDISQSELDALRARLRDNWAVPVTADKFVIRMVLKISRDGRLTAPPDIRTSGKGPVFEAFRDSAVRAVYLSQPFNMLRKETYESWRELDVEFDEKTIFDRR